MSRRSWRAVRRCRARRRHRPTRCGRRRAAMVGSPRTTSRPAKPASAATRSSRSLSGVEQRVVDRARRHAARDRSSPRQSAISAVELGERLARDQVARQLAGHRHGDVDGLALKAHLDRRRAPRAGAATRRRRVRAARAMQLLGLGHLLGRRLGPSAREAARLGLGQRRLVVGLRRRGLRPRRFGAPKSVSNMKSCLAAATFASPAAQ